MIKRYWITDAQLGCLRVLHYKKTRKEIIDEIIDKQFIGNKNSIPKEKVRKVLQDAMWNTHGKHKDTKTFNVLSKIEKQLLGEK